MQDEIKNCGHSRMRSEVRGHALKLRVQRWCHDMNCKEM